MTYYLAFAPLQCEGWEMGKGGEEYISILLYIFPDNKEQGNILEQCARKWVKWVKSGLSSQMATAI